MPAKRKILILGGGISGAVTAAELARRCEADIFLVERANQLGGLHRSVCVAGRVYDIGPFLFDEYHQIFETFAEVRHLFAEVPNRFLSLTPKGFVDDFPLSPRGYALSRGLFGLAYDAAGLLLSKPIHFKKRDVPAFTKYYIGPGVYKHSGFGNYLHRLYGIPDHEIAREFATKRLGLIARRGSLRSIVQRAFVGGIKAASDAGTASSVLFRGEGGFAPVYKSIHETLIKLGVKVELQTEIDRITPSGERFSVQGKDLSGLFDKVISTIPLANAAAIIGLSGDIPTPETKPLFSLFYTYKGEPGYDGTVLHNFTANGLWKRITTFSKFLGCDDGIHYFTVEGTLSNGKTQTLDDCQHDFERHVHSLGLFKTSDLERVGGVVTKDAYPLYRRTTIEKIEELKRQLRAKGLILTGRQGEFDYISSSDAAANAKETALKLAKVL